MSARRRVIDALLVVGGVVIVVAILALSFWLNIAWIRWAASGASP